MAYSITVAENGQYIVLKVTGTINRQLALVYNLEAHTLGKEKGISHFLFDFTECHNTDTVLRNYKYVYDDMQNPGINKAACTALLVNPTDHSHDFIEALFREKGFDFTLFHDHERAIRHLLK